MAIKPIIKNTSYYVPNKELDNEYFIKHFRENYDVDVTGLLNATGRNKRRVCDSDETILTMALNSTKKVLEKSNLSEEDIDMIVFSTGTPEFVQPCNALKLHNLLGCKKKVMIYDLNSSCVGMVVALTQVATIMKNNPKIKNAIVVGAEQFFSFTPKNSEIPYSNFGESACTILLENIETEDRGLLDYNFFTDSSIHDTIVLPTNGMKKALLESPKDISENMVSWIPFDADISVSSGITSIKDILEKNSIDKSKIKKYFISQFSKSMADLISEALDEDVNKFKFIGDKYGYTGTTSPFIALADSLTNEEVSKGDYVLFWSVGSGFTCHTSLFKL